MTDAQTLRRRLESISRLAKRLRDNTIDLHSLAYDPHIGDSEPDRGKHDSKPPRSGDPRAKAVLNRLAAEADAIEAVLVGLDRATLALFYARSTSPEPSRGSLISHREHDQLRANQRARKAAGYYTPAPLIDQPAHPGKRRP
jgi:hypothetical protein